MPTVMKPETMEFMKRTRERIAITMFERPFVRLLLVLGNPSWGRKVAPSPLLLVGTGVLRGTEVAGDLGILFALSLD